ncbi:MAG: hypothetical protein AAF846_06790 [Chloroflexota bacterium]
MKSLSIVLLFLSLFSLTFVQSAAHESNHHPTIGETSDSPIPIFADEPSTVDVIGEILRFNGRFESDDDEILVEFVNLRAGDTIYAYAAGIGRVDTYMYVLNDSFTDVFVEDNNSGGGYNAALSYQVEADGTYLVGLITREQIGRFQLLVGVNTPDIISVIDRVTIDDLAANLEPFSCADVIYEDRPVLSGDVLRYEANDFVIHYTDSGRDAATNEWITELAIATQRSLDIQLNVLGWALPPADCGEGGDTRLDIYVTDIDFALGIARPENLVGDNPNTDVVEFYAAYSYLVIENDLDYQTDRTQAFNDMRTTAAHEVHHNIQFGYDVNDRFFGFYEAGASWIETLVYPELTTAAADVRSIFSRPDRCIGAFRGRQAGDQRIYGEWVMIDSFTRDLGLESYQFIWEYMSENEGLDGFYRALDELGTTPQEVVARMAVRNLLRDYALGGYFSTTVHIEGEVSDFGSITPQRNGIQQLSADYIYINNPDIYNIRVDENDPFELYVVGINTTDEIAQVHELGTGGTIDTTLYDEAYIIIINTEQHSDSSNCEYASWRITISDGDLSDAMSATDEIWNAQFFEKPD